MFKNKIGSNKIQQRLGGLDKQRTSHDEYGYSNASRGPQTPREDDESGTLNAGFIATAVAVCLAVGSGVFIFSGTGFSIPNLGGPGNSEPFVSSADAACKVLWTTAGSN
ncbi:MAG: hypothetical protein H7X89_12360, partial [Rhizobiales bacterium]|nr:hypothetical protein [Hyphomicrobiales bacterium]